MATAEDLRKEFMEFMDRLDVKYTVFSESDNIVHLAFGGEKQTFVLVDFDEEDDDADSVHFVSQSFAKATKASMAGALVKLNEINRRFRWVKFHMDDDGAISADCDAVVFSGTVGEECTQIAFRMSSIIKDALGMLEGVAEIDEDTKRMLDIMAMMKGLD